MKSLAEYLNLVDHRITDGYKYQWQSFGHNAFGLESDSERFNDTPSYHFDLIFDTETQVVYSVAIYDHKNDRNYRQINPEYLEAYNQEYKDKVSEEFAAQDTKYIDLEDDEDFVTKALAIVHGREYDTKISIPLELSNDEIAVLALAAHEKNITLNEYMIEILTNYININK